jgi:predicted unusual protein kinase regulating ubiquinone biosynthesis (AarF/ABC1/UbiB family)
VLDDPNRCLALANVLGRTFDEVLVYPEQPNDVKRTAIPNLRFDRLLGSLTNVLTEFEVQLPPYFLSNCRALAIMEGNARMLDPSYNVLQALYPYALNRLLLNPSASPVVDATLWSLLTDARTSRVDPTRVRKLLDDSAAITGFSRRKVLLDILKTPKGRSVARRIAVELATTHATGRGRQLPNALSTTYFRL